MSRQSNLNFSNVDFNYIGDTSAVSHLINKRLGESPNKIQLSYELNLRNYQCGTTFKAKEPFMFPKTKDFKSVETDKAAFPYTSNTTINSPKAGAASDASSAVPYNDMFKLRNM